VFARIGNEFSEEVCANVVAVEDIRCAKLLCDSGCVGVKCQAAGSVGYAPKTARQVGRVAGCDGILLSRGVKQKRSRAR
jgi:hypothetical protein